MGLSVDQRVKAVKILRDDFELYARLNLKIKTKSGTIEPLIFNEPQKYIHSRLQEQLTKTGKIRSILLKGRQQGACLPPDMKVLKSDFEWVEIDNIAVGDRLLSVDEEFNGLTSSGRNQTRKMRVAIVEEKHEFNKELFEIILDNGTNLKSTGDHRWMSQQRGGVNVIWRDVNNLKVGDVLRAATYKPENITRTFDDGWIGGVLDADGSCSTTGAPRIGFSQVEGVILDKYKDYLKSHNIRFYETIDHRTKVGKYTKLGDKPVHCIRVDRFPDMVKLIARCNPVRFNKEGMYEGRKLSTTSDGFTAWNKIVSIKSLGISKVIDIQTSTKTFVAEGIVSHNSTYTEGRLYWRTSMAFGKQAYILTHEQAATDNLFGMAKRYHDNCDPEVKPETGAANAKELSFTKLDSGYKVGTAGSRAVGRSGTLQLFHGSELGFWPNAEDHFSGVMQCIPDEDGTEVILESTANGVGGKFHELWMKAINGESEFIAIFVPWFWSPEYRKEAPLNFKLTKEEQAKKALYHVDHDQLNWRRSKVEEMGQDLCDQEYPYCWQDAFLFSGRTKFEKEHLDKAMKECWKPKYLMTLERKKFVKHTEGELRVWSEPKPGAKYVIGADVAAGLVDGDYSCADVRDIEGNQMCQWHGHIAPDLFGHVLAALGYLYGKALICCEANNHGLVPLIYLRDSNYPNIYIQKAIDDRGSNEKEQRKLGFTTTSKSKPYLIDMLAAELREGTHGICCKETVSEMTTYVVAADGTTNAQTGCYDDRVMSYALSSEALRMLPAYSRLKK